MKRNYFKLLRKSFNGALLLGAAGAIVAFSPKTEGHLPPATNGAFFFDPSDYVNFTVTGYNADVIANGTSTTGAVSSTTNSVDTSNYCYYEIGSSFTASGSATTNGLPTDGVLTDPENADITYQMADYDDNNALRINGVTDAGTDFPITFAETGSYSELYLAVTSGDGASTISGTINFDDNTTQAFSSMAVPDWYGSTSLPVIIQGIGRVSRTSVNNPETPSGNPRIYKLTLTVDNANQAKTITGITFQNTGKVFNLFAVTGKLAADCPSPSEITMNSIDSESVSLSWTGFDANETYEVALVDAGADAPTTGTVVTTNAFSTNTLTSQTSYDFYVRTVCTVSGYSYWTGPYSFTTPCSEVTFFDEGFESANSGLPECWGTATGAGTNNWSIYSYSNVAHTGSNSMRLFGGASNDYLVLTPYHVTAHSNELFSFWARNSYSSYSDDIQVVVSTTGTNATDFTDVLGTETISGTTYNQYTYDLTAYDGQTIIIAIKASSSSFHYVYVDDVLTEGIPYCAAPTNLFADATMTDATLTWESDAASMEIVVQDAGTGEPTTAGTVVTDYTYAVTYTAGDIQEFYVRNLCDDGVNYSPWAGPYSFGGYKILEIASGLSDDVIANGVGASASSTTNDVDGGDYAYLAKDFKVNETDADLTYGLPTSGSLSSPDISGLNYMLADYSGNNSLRMETNGVGGTLTFTEVYPAETLYFLVVAGSGPGGMAGTINFTDGTTQAIGTTTIPNWFYSSDLPVVISSIGRVKTTTEALENPSDNPRIYELAIAIDAANQSKTIASIDLTKDSTGNDVVNVFAVSMKYSSYALSTNVIEATTIAVYPNPVKNNLYVQGVEATGVEVYNMLGQQMNVVLTNNAVNMSGLDNGIYLVTIHSENGDKTMRVVKN